MDVHKGVAGMHCVAFGGVEFHHTAGELAGNAHGSAFHLPLDEVVGAVHEHETCYGHGGHGKYNDSYGDKQGPGTLFSFNIVVCGHVVKYLAV